MQGEPGHMQDNPHYDDVVAEVGAWLCGQAAQLEALGVAPQRICLDPGPGFGKDADHNRALLQATHELALLTSGGAPAAQPYPLMAAYSRKAFIGVLTGEPVAARRDPGSVAVACYAALQGAAVLRVHNVAATAQALAVCAALASDAGGERP
jgi:dihydropteroate synthase